MNEHQIRATWLERIRREFVEWSGGYSPCEVDESQLASFLETAAPADIDPALVKACLVDAAFRQKDWTKR